VTGEAVNLNVLLLLSFLLALIVLYRAFRKEKP